MRATHEQNHKLNIQRDENGKNSSNNNKIICLSEAHNIGTKLFIDNSILAAIVWLFNNSGAKKIKKFSDGIKESDKQK